MLMWLQDLRKACHVRNEEKLQELSTSAGLSLNSLQVLLHLLLPMCALINCFPTEKGGRCGGEAQGHLGHQVDRAQGRNIVGIRFQGWCLEGEDRTL